MSSTDNSPNTVPPTSSPLLSSPMVSTKKRVAQTYGSKRAEAQRSDGSPDADISFGTLVDGDISISLSPAANSHGIDDNVVSSQGTRVDGDNEEEENSSPKQRKHKWSWETALNELSDSEEEGEVAPTVPIPHADRLPSPPASRGRSVKSKAKCPAVSPKKHQRLPLTTIRSDSRAPARVSAEPGAGGSDVDNSPSPSPPKPKRRVSPRRADTIMTEDLESEAPHASSSKSQGSRFSADVVAKDDPPLDSTRRKRKSTTGRKPTAKVNYHDIRSISYH